MNTNIELYIISYDTTTNDRCFLSVKPDAFMCPSLNINDSNNRLIEEDINSLLETYVDIGYQWVTYKLFDCRKTLNNNETSLNISYACSIPAGTKLKNAYYVSKNISIIYSLARKALYYV